MDGTGAWDMLAGLKDVVEAVDDKRAEDVGVPVWEHREIMLTSESSSRTRA